MDDSKEVNEPGYLKKKSDDCVTVGLNIGEGKKSMEGVKTAEQERESGGESSARKEPERRSVVSQKKKESEERVDGKISESKEEDSDPFGLGTMIEKVMGYSRRNTKARKVIKKKISTQKSRVEGVC